MYTYGSASPNPPPTKPALEVVVDTELQIRFVPDASDLGDDVVLLMSARSARCVT